jgi:hypothetical protein
VAPEWCARYSECLRLETREPRRIVGGAPISALQGRPIGPRSRYLLAVNPYMLGRQRNTWLRYQFSEACAAGFQRRITAADPTELYARRNGKSLTRGALNMMSAPEQSRTRSSTDAHRMPTSSWRGRAADRILPSDQPRPTPKSIRDSMSRFGRRAIPWLCLLLMASTAAQALQLSADTLSPTAGSAKVAVTTYGSTEDPINRGSSQLVFMPIPEYDTTRGAPIEAGVQCIDMGDRLPSNVLGAMTTAELGHLQATLCLSTRAANAASEPE